MWAVSVVVPPVVTVLEQPSFSARIGSRGARRSAQNSPTLQLPARNAADVRVGVPQQNVRHLSSRSDRVTALELLWQAALAERVESYFSIMVSDRASPERQRAIDEFLAREVEPDGIALFAARGLRPEEPANRPRARRLPSPESR